MRSLQLATSEDMETLLPLVTAFHAEQAFAGDEAHRRAALQPLLDGSPHGAIWLIGPRKAPVGYIAIPFGWSIEYGGLDGIVDEIYIRPAVRGRGMGSEALFAVGKALKSGGVRALHLEVDRADEAAQKFYTRARFAPRDGYMFMSRVL